jgi:hypothetical protein
VAADQESSVAAGDAAPDPGRDFAALMSSAAAAAGPGPSEAPFGWTTDRETGVRRPKKTAGRPRKSPSLEDLKAARADADATGAGGPPPGAGEPDRAPAGGKRRRRNPAPGDDLNPPIADGPGMITKGVNRLYRRAGRIVKAMDPDIGTAIIEATRNSAEKGEPDDSVGAAWEEVCKTNPRIRRFVLRCLAGGAWGQLFWAHAPILLAIILKDGIRKHLPMARFLEAMLEDDNDTEDQEPGAATGLLAGLEPGDLQQMMGLAQQMMGGMAGKAAAA